MNGLKSLSGWSEIKGFFAPRSAQGYLNSNQVLLATSGCGSACGADDEPKPQPSACGAGDEPKPQPSACGAGDDPKPSACGAGGK